MKVFIEQTSQTLKKNVFNKKTGAYEKTVDFHITYPYPYGYILDTLAADGDELDCYVITDKELTHSSVVECVPIGMVEYFEDDQADHKILVVIKGDECEISEELKNNLLDFDKRYFEGNPSKKTKVGDFLDVEAALTEITKSTIGKLKFKHSLR